MKDIDEIECKDEGMEEAVKVMVQRCLDRIVENNDSTDTKVVAFATTLVTTELDHADCEALNLDKHVWFWCDATIGSFIVGDSESDYMEFEIFSIATPQMTRTEQGFEAPAQLCIAIRCTNFDLWSDGLDEEGAVVVIPSTDFGEPFDPSQLPEIWQGFWELQDEKPASEAERKIRQIAAYSTFMMDDAFAAALLPARWS